MWTALKSLLSFCWSFVVTWIKGSGSNEDSTLIERDAGDIAGLRDRVTALETALAVERAERLRVLDEKADSVRDAAGAAELLVAVTKAGSTDPAK